MSSDVLRLTPRKAHALWADTYDRDPNPLLALEERIVEQLLPTVQGLRVLDVACGTGRWLEKLIRGGANEAVGLDLSPEMLNEAVRKPGLPGRLLQAGYLAIPFPDATVDVAICSFGLSYTPNLSGFAKELSRVVDNRGHVILSDFHPSGHKRGWKRRFRYKGKLIEVSSVQQYSLERIRATFAAEAFELVNQVEPPFGSAERRVFEQCGKEREFQEALGQAAIYVCHFWRTARHEPS